MSLKHSKKLLILAVLLSCNSKQHKPRVKEGVEKIVGVYTVNKTKNLAILLRKISKVVKFDTVEMQDAMFVDTVWGYPSMVPIKDSLGKPVLDSLKQPKMSVQYVILPKDSVNWKVENINVDDLIK